MNVSLIANSQNKKLGTGVATTVSGKETCPESCPLKQSNTCYAAFGPLNLHWLKVTDGMRGVSWKNFIKQIKKLPKGHKMRLNSAGDLPVKKNGSESIWKEAFDSMVNAIHSRKIKAWGYTHKRLSYRNLRLIKSAAKKNVYINASADSLEEADAFRKKGVSVVVTVPKDFVNKTLTPDGNVVVLCPQQRNDSVTCAKCMLCAKADRKQIVGFVAHGTNSKKLNQILAAQ